MRFPLALLFMACLAFAQVSTEGGNVSDADAGANASSVWFGACGQASDAAFVPVSILATPGNVSFFAISTGASSCSYGPRIVNLLFSNSSAPITSISPGNLALLDSFIWRPSESATGTFVLSTSYITGNFGTISGVPTTYTNSAPPGSFPMGYMQDQAGNIVIIAPLVSDRAGYNGSVFDFQLMLPTRNSTPVSYYLSVDILCNPPNGTTPETHPSTGGGGTHTPYPVVPTIPIPPTEPSVSLAPEDIRVILDYTSYSQGSSGFTLRSTHALTDVVCFVRGDFENYTTVTLSSDSISENGSLSGTITVSMTPLEVLDYNRGTTGTLLCTARLSDTLISSTATGVLLIIHKPSLEMENRTVEVLPGSDRNFSTTIWMLNCPNCSVTNLTAIALSNDFLIDFMQIPPVYGNESVKFWMRVHPEGNLGPYDYEVPVQLFEFGRLVGSGKVIVRILPVEKPPVSMCEYPDLRWTLIILLAGLLAAVIIYRKQMEKEEQNEAPEKGAGSAGEGDGGNGYPGFRKPV